MPPRARRLKVGTPVTSTATPAKPKTTVAPKSTPDAPAVEKKDRKERVTPDQAVILSDFVVADNAPPLVRKSTRENPFAIQVKVSYEKNLEAVDQWVAFTTTADAVENQLRLIRAAAASLEIGSAIRIGEPTATGEVMIWFRGQDRKTRKPKGDTTP